MDYNFDSMTATVEADQGGMVTPPALLDPCVSQDFVFDIDSDFEMTTADAGLGNTPGDGRTAPQNVTRTSPPWLSPPRCGPTRYNPTLGSPPRHSPTWRGPCNCRDRTREPWTSPVLQGTRAAFEETWGLIDGTDRTFEAVAPLQLSRQTTTPVTPRLRISQDSDSDFDFNSDIDSDSEPTAAASGYVNAPQYGMTAAQNARMTSPPWLSPPRCRLTWYSPPGGSPPRHSPTWHGPCSPPIMESQTSALPAASSYGEFAEDLVCSICLELFRKPVLLQCGHSFCQSCIDTVCLNKMASPCPVCRKMFAKGKYIKIVALDRLAEKVREGSPARSHRRETCSLREQNEDHWGRLKLDNFAEKVVEGSLVRSRRRELYNGQEQSRDPKEKLEHFCKNDGSLACQDAPKRTDQRFLPMQDAGSMYKLELSSMAAMFKKLLLALSAREVEMVDKWQVQEETAKKMMDCLQQLKEDCQKVQETLESAKRSFDQGDPLEFLKGIKFCLKKCLKEHIGRDPATGQSCTFSQLLSQVPLEYTILQQLQSSLRPAPSLLTLNPNTAHHDLIVSEDRTSVWYSSKPCQSPHHHHHKSFRACAVLASQGFTSGKHYWEVHVGNASNWVIGVAEEYVNREKDAEQLIEGAFWVEDDVHQLPWTTVKVENDAEKLPWGAVWALELNEFEILQRSGTAEISSRAISIISRPSKIRVFLDFNSGLVAFYDAEDLSLIRSMRFLTRSKIFPYFCPCTDLLKGKSEPLTLCF